MHVQDRGLGVGGLEEGEKVLLGPGGASAWLPARTARQHGPGRAQGAFPVVGRMEGRGRTRMSSLTHFPALCSSDKGSRFFQGRQ